MDLLLIAGPPALLLAVCFVVSRRFGISLADLGFRPFSGLQLLMWGSMFILLFVAEEAAASRLGLPSEQGAWIGKYDMLRLLIRIAFVALIYPFAEEVMFRGLLFERFHRRGGAMLAIPVSAAAFALAHVQYGPVGMSFVFADALFYALCRWRTGSLWLPILFHVVGNTYAVVERLS